MEFLDLMRERELINSLRKFGEKKETDDKREKIEASQRSFGLSRRA